MLDELVFGFAIKVVLCTFAGAVMLWGLESDANVERYAFGKVTSDIANARLKMLVQGAIFVCVGTFIGLLFTHPSTVRQGFTAGVGWTAGLNSFSERARRQAGRQQASGNRSRTQHPQQAKEQSKSGSTNQ
jgi:hypothetical protein